MEHVVPIVITAFAVGGGLAGLFMVLLSMPKSKLRDFLMPIIGLGFALFSGVYLLSPVDLFPEIVLGPVGLIDDVGVLIAGVMAAKSAMKARQLN